MTTPRYRWLILVHLLPSTPSNLRVRTWRRLQQLGAIAVKQSVYVLPDSPAAREDFEWLKTEISSAGGEATVFAADTIDAWSGDALVDEFRRARQADYTALARDLERALKQSQTRKSRGERRLPQGRQRIDSLRQRMTDIERIDFFGGRGRERAAALLVQLEARTPTVKQPVPASGQLDPAAYRKRVWVTRPRPGVDRMASAWLIKRFIDPEATFGFLDDPEAAPPGAVAFDMFNGAFSHHGDRCTFETLRDRFALRDPALEPLAAVVHDLDMKDAKSGAPNAAAIGELIDGMQLANDSDDTLLAQGIALFEALYQAAARARRSKAPPRHRPGP